MMLGEDRFFWPKSLKIKENFPTNKLDALDSLILLLSLMFALD